jgi:hypothetical protein
MSEGPDRPGAESGDLGRHSEEAEVPLGEPGEIAHMLDDRDLGAEQCGVNRTGRVVGVVDVERVNADEHDHLVIPCPMVWLRSINDTPKA